MESGGGWRLCRWCLQAGLFNQTWGGQAEAGWEEDRGKEAGWTGAAREKPCCTWRPLREWVCLVVMVVV